jgi:CDP-6-deoxy-D-xylo-4-hexulose-3-dehydrase
MKKDILSLVRDYSDKKLKPKKFIPGKSKVPASGASLSSDDIESLTEAVLSFWYTEGKFCKRFSNALSGKFIQTNVTLCNSGSSAFPTAIAPIYQTGHIPIYVDIDPRTLSPDFEQYQNIVEKYKDKIAGVSFVHTLGFPFDEQAFDEISPGFTIIDCCDAMGAEILVGDDWLPVGTFSDVVTLSFFPAHHIFTGEGGAVLSSNDHVSKIVDSFANWGRDCYCAPGQDNTCGKRFDHSFRRLPDHYDHKYTFTRLGYNLKMTEFQAALGFSQLDRLSTFVEKRKKNYEYLFKNLYVYNDDLLFLRRWEGGTASPFGFPILVNTSAFTTEELIQYLEEHKVSTRRVFAGNITRQPGYNLPSITMGLSGSNKVMEQMFWIGVSPNITKQMLDYVIEVFDAFFKEKGL